MFSGNSMPSKQKKQRGFKMRAFVTTIVALSILLLMTFEYSYFIALSIQSSPGDLRSEIRPGSDNYVIPRIGFVQRRALRAEMLHESDVFLLGVHVSKNIEPPPTKEFSGHPRVVALREDQAKEHIFSLVDITRKSHMIQRMKNITVLSMENSCCSKESDYFTRGFERAFMEECEPLVEPTVHFTCNSLHELNMESEISLISTKGSWRTTWKIDSIGIVLKTLNWNRDYDLEATEAHNMDAIVMDRLSASPYTVNSYGFCGQSVLTEWAPNAARDHVKSYDVKNRERLKIARDLARGLADLQMLRPLPEYSNIHQTPKFAHNDVNIANIVYINGKVKWNDFNIGILLRTKRQNKTMACGSPCRFKGDLWRSPEEIMNTSYVRTEQSDVYGFGNILFQIMTRHQPWTHKEPEGKLTVHDVAERKKLGRLPTIPDQYKNTSKPELMTMFAATLSCFHPDPNSRPTAIELANSLGFVYDQLKTKNKVSRAMIGDLFFKR